LSTSPSKKIVIDRKLRWGQADTNISPPGPNQISGSWNVAPKRETRGGMSAPNTQHNIEKLR